MNRQQQIIIFEGWSDNRGRLAKRYADNERIPYFSFDADSKLFVDKNIDEIFDNTIACVDPYMIEFLEKTNTSIIFGRKFPTRWVLNALQYGDDYNSSIINFIDDEYARLDTIIVYCYDSKCIDILNDESNLFTSTHKKYIEFFNNSLCKTISIDTSEDEYKNLIRIESFVYMHQKLQRYRNSFFRQMINYGMFVGNDIVFIVDKDFDNLTKSDVVARYATLSAGAFEHSCVSQFRNSDTFKFIQQIVNNINSLHISNISCLPIMKTDFDKILPIDADFMKLELNLLRPKVIVTFSKKIEKFLKKIEETRWSAVKYIERPLVYTNEIFDFISNEIMKE